ncbi:MAG: DUF2683 family protein [Candidatus Diapherotrites archaeon]|nr:DUF2683 family protein [Candidatus Diapherotrites archaeon]
MVKIQIDLSNDEDRIVEIFKVAHALPTKELTIRKMIKFFKVRIEPEKLKKKEYFAIEKN